MGVFEVGVLVNTLLFAFVLGFRVRQSTKSSVFKFEDLGLN